MKFNWGQLDGIQTWTFRFRSHMYLQLSAPL